MTAPPRPGRLTTPVDPSAGDKVAIVIVNWNGRPFLQRALESIARYTRHRSYELVVVDNGSEDDSVEYLAGFEAPAAERLEIICNPDNRFFSAAFNQGFNAASPDSRYLMVFCNDVEAKEAGWLRDYVEAIRASDAIAAGRATRRALPEDHRRILRESCPDYGDAALAEGVHAAGADTSTRYRHLDGYCFLLDRARLRRSGLYLEGGPFRQYHSDWELYLRFHVLGERVASFVPRVHHWHSISELIADHPVRYAELLQRIEEPRTLDRYLAEGRPLFHEESGYRSRAAGAHGQEEA